MNKCFLINLAILTELSRPSNACPKPPPPLCPTCPPVLLLVIGGSRGCNADMINVTTLIDLTAIGGSVGCAIPAPYPIPIKGAASGVVNNLATVCGGFSSRGNNPVNVISDCYQMNTAANSWSKTSDMPQTKAYTGFDSSSSWGLVVSGGFTGTGVSSRLEHSVDGVSWTYLAHLPESRSNHCLRILNDYTLLIIGGTDGIDLLSTAYKYDKTTSTIFSMAPFPNPRAVSGCGIIETANSVQLIVAGGTEYGNSVFMGQATNLVDIFDIPTNTWRTGTPLPTVMEFTGSVPYTANNFLLVGGANGNIRYHSILQYNGTFLTAFSAALPSGISDLAPVVLQKFQVTGC